MAEKFSTGVEGVASGTDKTILTIFHAAATPTCRGSIEEVDVGGQGTPADDSAALYLGRITAVGTEGSGLVPNNIDPGGPAGEMDSGLGVFSVEPTYTAAKQLLRVPLNHRNTYRWVANLGWQFRMSATQNNGAGLKSVSADGTSAFGATMLFEE